ncbi:nuclear protein localization protein 4 homolog isoform X2 [Hylaeus volcanicus]|nr:nuclear protein localization protein 4 homolog isoform X2 [Hylaeus volcanicus]
MTKNLLTIRIFTEDGLYRLDVDQTLSCIDFKRKVEERCNLSSKQVLCIFLDSKYEKELPCTSNVSIEKYVTNGQTLYTRLIGNDNSELPDDNNLKESESSELSKVQVTQNPEDSVKESTSKPHFVSFDHYLSCSGYNTLDLPLSRVFKPQPLVRGTATTIPTSATLKHQSYRCVDHIEFRNVQEMNQFVNYWGREHNMEEQRAGFLYGFFIDDPHYPMGIRVVVEAIYEPPQVDKNGEIFLLEDPQKHVVDRIANALQIECVGFIFTHLPREDLFSPEDLIRAARFQLDYLKDAPKHYTGYPVAPFVSVTISPDMENNSFQTNAFIISDLGLALVRDNLITTMENSTRLLIKPAPPNMLLPQILEGGKIVTTIDPHWFVVRVNDSAPKQLKSMFSSWSFSVENRNDPYNPPDVI